MSMVTRSPVVVLVAVAALGATLVLFRSSPAGSATPTVTLAPSPSSVTLAQFKIARDLICIQGLNAQALLEPRYGKIFDATATAAEQADGLAALDALIALSTQTTNQLETLDPPASLVSEHAADIAQYRDVIAILSHESQLLHGGKRAEAQAVDDTTDSVTAQIEAWEGAYHFIGCPY